MTEKRFRLRYPNIIQSSPLFEDNGKGIDEQTVCDLLNELHEENQQYKSLLQDMGLLLKDEDIKEIRQQISDKLLIPLIESQGYSVKDIDMSNGFNIMLEDKE